MLHFHVEYDGYGAHVCWYKEVPIADMAPSFLRDMIADDDRKQKVSVVSNHVHLKWWEKLFGISLEFKVRRTTKKMHKRLLSVQRGYDEIDFIRNRLEEV